MNKNYKPGHKLTAFVLIIVALYGLMAISGIWTPRLGLDLKGGTTVTLTANATNPDLTDATTGAPTAEAMQEALSIIQQRVDSLGVGESSVALQGARQIEVAVPNVDSQELVGLIGETAQLSFRNVYQAVPVTVSTAPIVNQPSSGTIVWSHIVTVKGSVAVQGNITYGTSVTVDDGNGHTCTSDVADDASWSCWVSLPDGAASLKVTATDATGTVYGPVTVSVTVNSDTTTAPTLTSPAADSTVRTGQMTLTGVSQPGMTVSVNAGNGLSCQAVVTTDGSWSCDMVLPNGKSTLTLVAKDANGNATQEFTTTVTVDPSMAHQAQLPTAAPTTRPTEAGQNQNATFDDLMAWQPSSQDTADFSNWNCDYKVQGGKFPDGTSADVPDGTLVYPDNTPIVDVWDQPLFSCGTNSDGSVEKYLLGPAVIQGTHLTGATAGVPQGQVAYQVNLSFDSTGASQFSTATTKLYSQSSPMNQFAIVLDAKVISAPVVNEPITGGQAQITGSFTAEEAQSLARVLRYGALPLAFEVSSVDTVSPTLGGEQLRAGIIAGIIGLILTLLYAFIYYRALAIIVVGSLASAAVLTYAAIVLLGTTVGFALNLPGIAGAILAIGVTADSFIVYFERIRDEIRDGYSLARSIESGWTKARGTIVVADSVQLLSAVVLFFLAIGSVRGFAFTLLVTTLIDLFIVFFFSKPLMTLLGRTKYFRSGNPMSGFDPEHLGVSPEALRGRRASAGTIKTKAKEA